MNALKLRKSLSAVLSAIHEEAHSQGKESYQKRLRQRLSEYGFDFQAEVTFLPKSGHSFVADLVISDRYFVFLKTESAHWQELLASYAQGSKLKSGALININEPELREALKFWPKKGDR